MSDSIKDRITADLQKAKAAGGLRAGRIREIVQTAAAQALAEFKDGSGEIRTIAKGSFSTVVETLNDTNVNDTSEAAEPADKRPSSSFRTLVIAAFQAIKTRLLGQLQQESTDLQKRWVTIDAKLSERYGDRYTTAKQRLNNARAWYNTVAVQAEAQETTPLQQKQTEFEGKASEVGAAVGKREQQVRQQVKQFLESAAAKL